ncbi:MAG: hypothetical protein VKL39_01490 [Leptolyngbyaceae bacterium]|nr:hypothetical protein [Leptolyngbyaceae bacterium]
MKKVSEAMIEWLKSPWPFFISLALGGITALATSLHWIYNETKPPSTQSLIDPAVHSSVLVSLEESQETSR